MLVSSLPLLVLPLTPPLLRVGLAPPSPPALALVPPRAPNKLETRSLTLSRSRAERDGPASLSFPTVEPGRDGLAELRVELRAALAALSWASLSRFAWSSACLRCTAD